MRKNITEPHILVVVDIFSPALVLFLTDHHLHRKTSTFNCIFIYNSQILAKTSKPDWQLTRLALISSMSSNRQHIFANLHLKKICPQSSSNLLQTGHIVSNSTPRLATFLLTGRLLCANRHTNILTLLGTLSCQILIH